MENITKRDRYKIDFADVRLTPEQLKATEDKIESLELYVEDYEFKAKRMVIFIQKLSQIANLDSDTINTIFKNDVDYDIMVANNFGHSDKISIHFRQR